MSTMSQFRISFKKPINISYINSYNHHHQADEIYGLDDFVVKGEVSWGDIKDIPKSFNPSSHASAERIFGIGDATKYGHLKLFDVSNQGIPELGVEDGTAVTPKALGVVDKVAQQAAADAGQAKNSVLALEQDVLLIEDKVIDNEVAIDDLNESIDTISSAVGSIVSEIENLDEMIDNLVDANIYIGKVKVFTSAITNTAINEYIQRNSSEFLLSYGLIRINVIISDEDNQLWRCNYVQESPSRIAYWEKYSHYPNEVENSINSKFNTPVATIQGNGKTVGAVKEEITAILAANPTKLSFTIAIWGGWVLAANWSSEQFIIGQYYGNVYYQITNNQGSSAVITAITPTPDKGVLMASARFTSGAWSKMYQVADRDYVFSSVNSHNTDVEAHKDIRGEVTANAQNIARQEDSIDLLGGAISSLDSEIENLDEMIDRLVDANLTIGYINQFTSAVTDALLTARAVVLVGTSETSGLRKNMQLIDNDKVIWRCIAVSATPTYTATWENIGGSVPKNHASSASTYGVGNSSYYGHLKLEDSVNPTQTSSSGTAVTPKAVYDYVSSLVIGGENIVLNGYAPRSVSNSGTGENYIYYSKSQEIRVDYSWTVSFYAQASIPLANIDIFIAESGASGMFRNINITNFKTRYELVFTPSITSSANMRFDANGTGTPYTLEISEVCVTRGNKSAGYTFNRKDSKEVGSWVMKEVEGSLVFYYNNVEKQRFTYDGDIIATIF